jgi:hypothetical protein
LVCRQKYQPNIVVLPNAGVHSIAIVSIPMFLETSYFSMDVIQDQDLTIKSITVVPRSRNFYNFFINGTNEKRSMKLESLADFITKLCPAVGGKARIMIYEFRPFYVEIETDTLLELEEVPEAPEPRRALMFKGGKKIAKQAKEEKERASSFVDKRRQTIFGNILKTVRK